MFRRSLLSRFQNCQTGLVAYYSKYQNFICFAKTQLTNYESIYFLLGRQRNQFTFMNRRGSKSRTLEHIALIFNKKTYTISLRALRHALFNYKPSDLLTIETQRNNITSKPDFLARSSFGVQSPSYGIGSVYLTKQ